jgi:transposase-like protein
MEQEQAVVLDATMASERSGASEEVMVGQERWEEIRRLFFGGHVSVSEIARRFDLDRKTVRRCLRQDAWRPYERAARTDTRLAGHETFLVIRNPIIPICGN